MKKRAPGIAISVLLAFIAAILADFVSAMGTASWAIVLGLVVGQFSIFREHTLPGSKWSEKYILQTAVVLLGAQISLAVMSEVLIPLLGFILTGIILLLLAFFVLPQLLGKDSKQLYWLIAGGETVCGSAAVAAVSSSINSKSEDTAGAIIGVNLFSTIGLFVIPNILDNLNTGHFEDAIWTGGYLQSAGHAIAAGFALGDETGLLSTTFKLSRILLLVPMVVISGIAFRSDNKVGNTKSKVSLPTFLWLFILVVLIFNILKVPVNLQDAINQLDKFLISVALAAIGLNINLKSLVKSSGKAIPATVILTTVHLLVLFILLNVWKSF